jgi:hypothetical protein
VIVANGLSEQQLVQLAKLGAAKRLEELQSEVDAIEALIGQAPAGRPKNRQAAKPRRRKSGWSAAKRKAAAERMKAYWAKRKAGRKQQ